MTRWRLWPGEVQGMTESKTTREAMWQLYAHTDYTAAWAMVPNRSEERRVGKECRL